MSLSDLGAPKLSVSELRFRATKFDSKKIELRDTCVYERQRVLQHKIDEAIKSIPFRAESVKFLPTQAPQRRGFRMRKPPRQKQLLRMCSSHWREDKGRIEAKGGEWPTA